jgi:hypothetical protein
VETTFEVVDAELRSSVLQPRQVHPLLLLSEWSNKVQNASF